MIEAQTGRVISLVEWQSTTLTRADARRLAPETSAALRRVPGLVEIRFFGDFESRVHYYLQAWENRGALDAFMASESMFRIREIAMPFVEGRPARRIYEDYTIRNDPDG